MTKQQLIAFAQALIKEAVLVAEAFDGTIGDGAFRNRVATLYYGFKIFQELTANSPMAFLVANNEK